MNRLIHIGLCLLLLLGVAACSNNEDAQMVLSKKEVRLDAEGGTATFRVQTLGDWTIETDGQEWYTVSPMQGSEAAEVTVTADASTEVVPRTANVTVHCGSSSVALTVTQTGTENPVDPSDQEVGVRAKGGDRELVLPTNDGYEVTIPAGADWITLKEQKEKSLVLTFAPNTGTDQYRTAEVVVNHTDGNHLATLKVTQSWRNIEPGELLIEELYLVGDTVNANGPVDPQNRVQFVRLTNNTETELDIAGVAIAESAIHSRSATQANRTWTPDRREEVAAVRALYRIPADKGRQTLGPHESVLIANDAQNFANGEAAPFDLSKADFEWYNAPGTSPVADVDNPDVPDLDVWLSGTQSIYVPNVQMNTGFLILEFPSDVTKADFTGGEDYRWSGTTSWLVPSSGKTFEAGFDYRAVPNSWVLDAVVVGTKDDYACNPFCEALDAGYTYCAADAADTGRYGKSMRRKSTGGKLVDTDNSTNDFRNGVEASPAK